MSNCQQPGLIALDWGTTNVRLALLAMDGTVLEERRGESGVGTFSRQQFEDHFDKLTSGWPKLPAIAAGMVGSRQGWHEAVYLPCPASIDDLASSLKSFVHDGRQITIVPGLKMDQDDRVDVMRGEETQIAGFLTTNHNYSGTLIMPGTHSKWVRIQHGTVTSFQTYMTGELFDVISQHSLLRHSVSSPDDSQQDFSTIAKRLVATQASTEGALFGLRARQLLREADTASLRLELSALLILAELRAGQADGFVLNKGAVLIGTESLTHLYKSALGTMGKQSSCLRGTGLVWQALHELAGQSCMNLGMKA